MDTKLTLHFEKNVIEKAKEFASANNISLSRLTEYLYRQITSGDYKTFEEFPVADWVNEIAEGEPVYKKRSRKNSRKEYYQEAGKKLS
jgi:hypothetical protein